MSRRFQNVERRSLTRVNPEEALIAEEARADYLRLRATGTPRDALVRAFHAYAAEVGYPDAGAWAWAMARVHHDQKLVAPKAARRAAADALFEDVAA